MKAVGYCWAEMTDGVEDLHTGIPRFLIETFIKKKRWPSRGIFFEDKINATVPFEQRPVGGDIAKLLSRGDVLVVPSQDCFFRTASDGLSGIRTFRKRGIIVYSLDLNADITNGSLSETLLAILGPLAAAETELPRDRAKKLKHDKKSESSYLGGKIPFGYKVDPAGKLVPDRKQQSAIRKMIVMRSKGISLREISEEMKRQGITISHVGVSTVIKKQFYLTDFE